MYGKQLFDDLSSDDEDDEGNWVYGALYKYNFFS